MRLALVATLALASCGQKQDDKICLDAPALITPGDMQGCVHKWAYRLAGSGDPAGTVAKAVVRACRDVADALALKAAADPAVQAAGDPDEERSRTFQVTMADGEAEALFRVVQARAGNCDIP